MHGRWFRLGITGGMALIALSIGLLALAIRTAAPTAASTGSVVNIADGKTASNLASVSSTGALSVQLAHSAGTYPAGYAPSALALYAIADDDYDSGCPTAACTAELIGPTQATIDVTSLTVSLTGDNANSWEIDVEEYVVYNGTAAGQCWDSGTSREVIQIFQLQPGTTTVLSPGSPIVVAPPSGSDVCLVAIGLDGADNPSANGGFFAISMTGYVASGTYSESHTGSDAARSLPRAPGTAPKH